jgi:predicted amino acid dehydrogenase
MEGKKTQAARYVGIDLGKRTYEVAIVGKKGDVTLSNGKTTATGRQALYKKLTQRRKDAEEEENKPRRSYDFN